MKKNINRRGFLKTTATGMLGAGVMGLSPDLIHGEQKKQDSKKKILKIKEYRVLGRTGFKVSDIGIGTSRQFPVEVIKMLLDAGVNYIDTAERYGRGQSETNVGKAIKGRDRKSLFITSKLNLRGSETKEEIIERTNKCLERLQTPYIDCMMIHSVSMKTIKMESFHQAAKQLKGEGKLRFIGVSNHGPRFGRKGDSMEKVLLAAATDGRFDVMLIVYNFLKKTEGEAVIEACKKKNIGVTIMKSNPVGRYYSLLEKVEQMKKEGKKVDDRTKRYFDRLKETAVQAEVFAKKHDLKDPSEISNAALRFVLNNPKVDVLNLAFGSFEDVEKFLPISGSRLESKDKKKLIMYEQGPGNFYCRHACGICETNCPHDVPVNTIMRYNHYFDGHGSEKYAMDKYASLDTVKAELCQDCSGHCESACPFNIPIKGLLTMAHQQLTLV